MDTPQPSLFSVDDLPVQPSYDVDAVRGRLEEMLSKMHAAASWPWKAETVAHYRARVWPALLDKLPDADEAARIRGALEAERKRLDAA